MPRRPLFPVFHPQMVLGSKGAGLRKGAVGANAGFGYPVRGVAMTQAREVDILSILPDLQLLWNDSLGDPEIVIAVLDGPVDTSHPCFQGANLTHLET